ncbi:MAG: divalent metal cation transporter [Verrucomicrobiota bacterium]
MSDQPTSPQGPWWRSIGPAIIVASVVLGPGSILTSSKVGAQYGYQFLWLILAAGCLMTVTMLLSSRLGLVYSRTLCGELGHRLGRAAPIAIGIILFLIIVGFQASNNLAVLAAIEPFQGEAAAGMLASPGARALLLMVLNGLAIAFIYGFKKLYRPIEKVMMVLVLFMIAGFLSNLFFAGIDFSAALKGLLPSIPENTRFFPYKDTTGVLQDPFWAVQGLIATTFSVAGAFYQAYLIREKGWNTSHLRQGSTDLLCGIAVLGGISLIIMMTSASSFFGKIDPKSLTSAASVATQLEPLFGQKARFLFGVGLFAGAFSSFLGNALIGGTVFADGLGKDCSLDGTWTRRFTVLVLVLSAGIALALTLSGSDFIGHIIFAQALTILGVPVLALALIYLATRPEARQSGLIPGWMPAITTIGLLVSIAFAIRTAVKLGLG